ncbi:hypothetical protein C5167_038324 [Papaver somniferum]|uniref:Uncharacterized protein n=1 Tax=Papaver somniferum TaxID=3469 RepID=A0A4Y7ID70_PAPSO|nr:hypothetical protein C5167_038324 [Papaver somniferum]
MSTSKKLYAGKIRTEKSKGAFHHSEFPCRWGCFIYHGPGKAETRKNNLGYLISGSVPYKDI